MVTRKTPRKNPNDTAAARETPTQRATREKAEERKLGDRLIEWGGGIADKAEMFAHYQQLLARKKARGKA